MKGKLLLICFASAFVLKAQINAGGNTANDLKLSATSRLYVDFGDDKKLFFPEADGRVTALVQLKNADLGFTGNYQVESYYGDVVSMKVNRAEILNLLQDNNVQYIDVSCRLNRVRLLNDTTRILSKVDMVQNGLANGLPANYRGAGVIVGIVDIGFQTDNPTFYNNDGSAYRVKRFWQQNEKSGTKPAGFSYGSEYTTPLTIQTTRDEDGTHATHVAGIAGGSGFTTPNLKYRGMAPESDLVFVTIKYTNDTLGGSAKGDYIVANPSILDGFKYVYNYAQSVGKPAVINLSWGMHTGPHDGTSLFDKAIEKLTGPGKIFVGANGNDGGNQIHISKKLTGDTQYTFAVDRSRNDYVRESQYFDFWGDSAQTLGLNFSLFDTLGNKKVESPFYYSTLNSTVKKVIASGTDTIWLTLAANKKFVNNGKPEIIVVTETNFAKNQRLRIGITGNGTFNAWNSGQPYRWTTGSFLAKVKGNDYTGKYLDGLQTGSMGENGGTGKATISVGAYTARKSWTDTAGVYHARPWLNVGELAGFSSRGPTPDGRIKPDVAAPGDLIASSINYRQMAGWMLETTPYRSFFGGHIQFWSLFSGTSMAAPHVTGIVALMLQVNPNLNPSQTRDVLQKTALRDAFTGADSNVNYGWGKVNAYEAVKMLVKLMVKNPGKNNLTCKAYPVPTTTEIYFSSALFAAKNCELFITDLTGRTIHSSKIKFDSDGMAMFDTRNIADGTYIWQIKNTQASASGRMIVLK